MLTSIPSPSTGEWHLGPLPIRAYALAIIAGIFLAVWLTERRWRARGGRPGVVGDIAVWAVPFGVVGGRLYHVITSPDAYFGEGGDPLRAFAVWEGGLGIWGAIALGAVGAVIGARRHDVPFAPFADAAAPGIVLAQAVGRLGNWFNQELYGRETDLPWALEIDRPGGGVSLHHPTFLYELLWCVGVAALLLWADRRFRLGGGRVFWLYVAGYTLGRWWIEALRIDPAHRIAGLRVNEWVSLAVLLFAVAMLVRLRDRHSDDPAEVAALRRTHRDDAGTTGETGDATATAPDESGDEPARIGAVAAGDAGTGSAEDAGGDSPGADVRDRDTRASAAEDDDPRA